MSKIFNCIGCMAFLIGVLAVPGAIEFGEGITEAIAILVVGLTLLLIGTKGSE